MADRLLDRRLSVAPMMDWTTRHCRYFHRLIAPRALLYTEMVHCGAVLHGDVERLGERVGNLDRHFGQAAKDLEDIKISSEKAGRRAKRLDNFDFEELAQETPAANVVPLTKP